MAKWRMLFAAVVVVYGAVAAIAAGGNEEGAHRRYDIEPSQSNMEALSDALGVQCAYCHPTMTPDGKVDYERPSERKAISVYMKRHFVDSLRTPDGGFVGCVDCHRGRAKIIPRDTEGVPESGLASTVDPDEIVMRMRRISENLGVQCDACHQMRDDGRLNAALQTPRKVAAKYMMDHFPGEFQAHNRTELTCVACHAGRLTFLPRE